MLHGASNVWLRSSAQIRASLVQLHLGRSHPCRLDMLIGMSNGGFEVLVFASHDVAVNHLPADSKVFKQRI
jgi:hypothetical protein